jgi:hypothetical protein
MDEEVKRTKHRQESPAAETARLEVDDDHFQRGIRRLSQRLAGRDRTELPSNAIWLLPTAQHGAWLVSDDAVVDKCVQRQAELPQVIVPADAAQSDVAQNVLGAGDYLDSQIGSRLRRKVKSFFRMIGMAAALFIGGMIAVWFWPALGGFAMALGFSLGLYALARQGSNIIRTHYRRIDARSFSRKAEVHPSRLLARVSDALAFRASLKESELGSEPDKELLDAQAYRHLINERVTTIEELAALGRVVERELKLDDLAKAGRSVTQIASEAGLDTLTTSFYRDLAVAAAEVRLDVE